jgi:hypothetical protein
LELNLSAITVSSVGFEALAKLCNFREFLFNTLDLDYHNKRKIIALCIHFLPHLHYLGFRLSNNNNEQQDDMENCVRYHREIMLQNPVKLNLRELALGGDVQPFMSCQLPELQTLYFLRSRGDVVGVCDRFHNLSTLIFDLAHMDVIESVLQQTGERLSTLKISGYMYPQFLLNIVAGNCANLKMLSLSFRYCHVWSAPDGCLSFLEEIHLLFGDNLFLPGLVLQVSWSKY